MRFFIELFGVYTVSTFKTRHSYSLSEIDASNEATVSTFKTRHSYSVVIITF